MHDTVWFENNGIPEVIVATEGFVDAAVAQSPSLGMPDVNRVFVPHPMQDQTDEEMHQRANSVIEQLLTALID